MLAAAAVLGIGVFSSIDNDVPMAFNPALERHTFKDYLHPAPQSTVPRKNSFDVQPSS
jgi:hypothetical protein